MNGRAFWAEAGAIDAFGGRPVPESEIMVGLVVALELMTMVPVSAPVSLGAKMRFNTQLAAGAILIGKPVLGAPPALDPNPHQWVICGAAPPVVSGKTPEFECVMLLSVSAPVPLLVMVMACTPLDPPTGVAGNVVVPVTVTAGAGAVTT